MVRMLPFAALFTALVGVYSVFASMFPGPLGVEAVYDVLFSGAAGPLGNTGRFGLGLAGALTTWIGVSLYLLAPALTSERSVPVATIRRAFLIGLVDWFVLDSLASVAAGAPLNVLGNVGFLVVIGLPLWALGRGRDADAPTGAASAALR